MRPEAVAALLAKPGMAKANAKNTEAHKILGTTPPKLDIAIDAPISGAPKKPYNKFKVSPKADRTADGITFSSKREMQVYQLLKEAGIPFELQPRFELQPKFELKGKKYRSIDYVGDFKITMPGREPIIVDVKGMRTPIYLRSAKMMAYVHRVVIKELYTLKETKAFIEELKRCVTTT